MNLKSVVAIVLITVSAALVACGRQGSAPNAPSAEEDARLFKLASWMAVADRYKDTPHAEAKALLINSVMNGSKGKWLTWKGGDGMPPLGRRVAQQDVEQLVDFILTLKR
jgi:hypothetical protein